MPDTGHIIIFSPFFMGMIDTGIMSIVPKHYGKKKNYMVLLLCNGPV